MREGMLKLRSFPRSRLIEVPLCHLRTSELSLYQSLGDPTATTDPVEADPRIYWDIQWSCGMVMACTAELARERVARVVFADALALFDGEKILDIVKRPTTAVDTPVARGPNRADAVGRLFAGLDPSLREWAADRITLHPAAVYNQPVKLERFWDLPWKASVLYCSQAPNPGEAHIRRAADKLKAKWHVIDTGHYPMLSTPDELTRVILDE